MFEKFIALSQHVPFVMLISAILLGGVIGLAARSRLSMIAAMIRYILLLAVGVTCLWEFVIQTFFAGSFASSIGVVQAPFQFEVALANLGLACAGIWAFRKSFDSWVTVAIMATCFNAGTALAFLWNMFFGHVAHAGHMLYADILTVFMLDLLLLYYYQSLPRHAVIHSE